MPAPRDCPCHSKKRYAACCGPLHKGDATAETAAALMRSRYAAFSLGLGEYLLTTLAHSHPDRTADAAELGSSRRHQRFMDLCILQEVGEAAADQAQVLFYARLFERGIDYSFVELSDFVREDGAWRYQKGTLVPAAEVPGDPRQLTRAAFDALAIEHAFVPHVASD